jgi:hypothetical protein
VALLPLPTAWFRLPGSILLNVLGPDRMIG